MCPRRRWGREGEGVVAYASHVIFHRLRPSLKSVWGTNRAHLIPSFLCVCPRVTCTDGRGKEMGGPDGIVLYLLVTREF